MDNEVKAIVASLQPPLADGKVGFFWVVSDRSGRDKLLAESSNWWRRNPTATPSPTREVTTTSGRQ